MVETTSCRHIVLDSHIEAIVGIVGHVRLAALETRYRFAIVLDCAGRLVPNCQGAARDRAATSGTLSRIFNAYLLEHGLVRLRDTGEIADETIAIVIGDGHRRPAEMPVGIGQGEKR